MSVTVRRKYIVERVGAAADKQYLTGTWECAKMPYRDGDPTVEVEASIEVTTAKAYLIHPTMGAKKEVWLPKSQVAGMSDLTEDGMRVFTVTEWWYKQAGLDDNGS